MSRTNIASRTNLTWQVMPQDQGQIVEIAYASDPEHDQYLRRTTDQSDMTESYEVLAYDAADDEPYEPWNGHVPSGDWEPQD